MAGRHPPAMPLPQVTSTAIATHLDPLLGT
jgi:hypothetical protein